MKTIKQSILALVFFALISGLLFQAYTNIGAMYDVHDVTYDPANSGKSIGERFSELRIIDGLNSIINVFVPSNPANKADIVGNLILGGLGALNTLLGTLTFPAEIGNIIIEYYDINALLISSLVVGFYVSVAFILIRIKTGSVA